MAMNDKIIWEATVKIMLFFFPLAVWRHQHFLKRWHEGRRRHFVVNHILPFPACSCPSLFTTFHPQTNSHPDFTLSDLLKRRKCLLTCLIVISIECSKQTSPYFWFFDIFSYEILSVINPDWKSGLLTVVY